MNGACDHWIVFLKFTTFFDEVSGGQAGGTSSLWQHLIRDVAHHPAGQQFVADRAVTNSRTCAHWFKLHVTHNMPESIYLRTLCEAAQWEAARGARPWPSQDCKAVCLLLSIKCEAEGERRFEWSC